VAGAVSPSHSSIALIDHLARLARARTDATLARVGLRPRHLVALTALRETGPTTQQALASVLAIDRTNLVGLLNELESAGFLSRQRSAADRRRHIVALTPEGERTLAAAERALATAETELLHGLTEEERCTLYELLQRATADHMVDCAEAAGLRDGGPGRDEDGAKAASGRRRRRSRTAAA
jgi:DNA-binding MarR family transcriptional regulator